MKKFFSQYNGIEEYYDIEKRLVPPWWAGIYLGIAERIFRSAGKVSFENIPSDSTIIDMHVHTQYSYCSFTDIRELLVRADSINLNGICIMDHHTIEGYKKAVDISEELKEKGLIHKDFIILPGMEISSKDGHVGAIFCEKDIKFNEYSAADTVKLIHDMGGIAVAVHPTLSSGLREAAFKIKFDAIEVYSGSIMSESLYDENFYCSNLEVFSNVAKIGGSDSHFLHTAGMCATVFPGKELGYGEIRTHIEEGNTTPVETHFYSKLRSKMKLFHK